MPLPPALSITDVTLAEGDADSTDAVFTVSLALVTDVTGTVDWVTGTDTGTPSSGMDGYSYVFNQSDTNPCNNDVDAGAVSGVSSVTLAPGTWYFHLCSVDVTGNTSDTITAGPYVIGADTVPPQVGIHSKPQAIENTCVTQDTGCLPVGDDEDVGVDLAVESDAQLPGSSRG